MPSEALLKTFELPKLYLEQRLASKYTTATTPPQLEHTLCSSNECLLIVLLTFRMLPPSISSHKWFIFTNPGADRSHVVRLTIFILPGSNWQDWRDEPT